MAFPPESAAHSAPSDTHPFWASFRTPKEQDALKKPEASRNSSSSRHRKFAKKAKSFSIKSRTRESSPTKNSPPEDDANRQASSTPTPCSTPPLDVFELPATSPRGQSTTRPKHIPIVIPDYNSFGRRSPVNETSNGSFSSSTASTSASGSPKPAPSEFGGYGVAVRNTSVDSFRERPRHVEIKIPDWAHPVIKRSNVPPRLSLAKSTFLDTFADDGSLSPPDLSAPSPAISQVSAMDSHTSEPSPTGLYTTLSHKGSSAYLSSAHSSQSSLVGMRAEYESASEAESTHDEPQRPSYMPASSASGTGMANTPPVQTPSSTSNLSGLVCNVHRTTGKEPHPLVGATTTILGDKLYVFGGRRLSRAKPQLTSNLYELDLIKRPQCVFLLGRSQESARNDKMIVDNTSIRKTQTRWREIGPHGLLCQGSICQSYLEFELNIQEVVVRVNQHRSAGSNRRRLVLLFINIDFRVRASADLISGHCSQWGHYTAVRATASSHASGARPFQAA